ncbi:MAG: ribokinase [Chloroflexota bacterium]|nr:MAG: ribokinase [Chloroflexota bacterium]
MKIVCVGESTLDYYLDLNRGFVGGISLNFAVHSKRCGAEKVALLSCVGSDPAGQLVRQKLLKEGIDTSHLYVQEGETARQNIIVTPTGERIFPSNGYSPGVLAGFHVSDADLEFIQQFDIVVTPLFWQIEPIFNRVMRQLSFRGKRVVDFLDLSDYGQDYGGMAALIQQLDLAFISGNQQAVDMLRPLSRQMAGIIVVTRGAAGSTALVGAQQFDQPAVQVAAAVDTTGCGDAFQAAFTVAYFSHGNVPLALQQGARQAAEVLQHYGASVDPKGL